jgi:hypothetical protein
VVRSPSAAAMGRDDKLTTASGTRRVETGESRTPQAVRSDRLVHAQVGSRSCVAADGSAGRRGAARRSRGHQRVLRRARSPTGQAHHHRCPLRPTPPVTAPPPRRRGPTEDLRRPWERPPHPPRPTSTRVGRGYRHLRARRPGHGRLHTNPPIPAPAAADPRGHVSRRETPQPDMTPMTRTGTKQGGVKRQAQIRGCAVPSLAVRRHGGRVRRACGRPCADGSSQC